MADSILYHEGNRRLQERLRQPTHRRPPRSQTLPALLSPTTTRPSSRARSTSFLATRPMRRDGPTSSFKGGSPGFVRVTAAKRAGVPLTTTATECSRASATCLRNPQCRPAVHRPCMTSLVACASNWHGRKVSRRWTHWLACTVGAQLIVRVTAAAIFPNGPRYIPQASISWKPPFIYYITAQGRPRSGRAGLENLRVVQGCCPSTPTYASRGGAQRTAADDIQNQARRKLSPPWLTSVSPTKQREKKGVRTTATFDDMDQGLRWWVRTRARPHVRRLRDKWMDILVVAKVRRQDVVWCGPGWGLPLNIRGLADRWTQPLRLSEVQSFALST